MPKTTKTEKPAAPKAAPPALAPEQNNGVLLTATPINAHHAMLIARTRARGHDHCRKPSETIGEPSEQALAEHYGALSEVIVLDQLFRRNLTPQEYILTAERAPSGPDFTLNGHTYQVKATLPGNRYLCINEQQRTDPRHHSDYVLPVVFVTPNTVRVLRPVPYTEVADWELRHGHSDYRSVDVQKLPALNHLEELTTP